MATLAVSLSDAVLNAVTARALEKHLDPKDYAARVLETHVEEMLDNAEQEDLALTRGLIDQLIDIALQRVGREGFSSSITFDSIQEASSNSEWIADYERLVRDDPYKTGNPRKQINQSFGYYIKKALGARAVAKPDGKPANVKVQGSIIQSYTPLER